MGETEGDRATRGVPAWETLGRLGLLHARTRAPAVLFALVMLVLTLERGAIAALMRERFGGATAGDFVHAFLTGLRFDAVIAAMLIVPLFPMLFLTPPVVIRWRPFRYAVAGYAALALTVTVFLAVADFFYFQEFGERLNHKVVDYLGAAGNEYLVAAVVRDYPVVATLLACAAVLAASVWLFLRAGFDDRWNVGPIWQAAMWPIVAIALTVLAIRGTVSSQAINAGMAYSEGSPAVAQLTLNGGFTLRHAVVSEVLKEVELGELYPLLPEDEAMRLTRELVVPEADQELGDPANPLRRVVDTGRPRRDLNVVMVVLESLSWHYVGGLGGRDLTPNLDALMAEGLSFERCYAVGGRTQRGFSGIVSGFPDLPKSSVTTRDEVVGRFITLGGVLQRRGYDTAFVYGGPAHRDHRASYLGSNGYDRMVCEDDLAVRTFRTKLGWCDDDLMQSLVRVMDDAHAADADRPVHALALTVTFHRPYEIPPDWQDTVSDAEEFHEQRRAIRYTDWAIGRFMAAARARPWYDDTLFVFVADHQGGYLQHPMDLPSYRVPFVVVGKPIEGLAPRRVEAVCNQMDVSPTVLSLLGGSYESCFFGSSVLDRPADAGFAIAQTGGEEILFLDAASVGVTVPPAGATPKLWRLTEGNAIAPLATGGPEQAARRDALVRRAVAVVQTADALFEWEAHNVGGAGAVARPAIASGE